VPAVTGAAAHGAAPDAAARGQDGADSLDALLRRAVACARATPAAGDGAGREPAVRAALGAACARARTDGLRAEHVLVRLKDVWAHTPEAPRAVLDVRAGLAGMPRMSVPKGDGGNDHDRLARVVTLCIEEFYQADGRR
jgi:hypothetical protein